MKIWYPKYPVSLHILVWALLLTIPTIIFWNHDWLGLTATFFLLSSIYHIGLFYINAYFLFPRLLTKRKWWLYVLVIVAIVFLSYHVKIFLLQTNPTFELTDLNKRVIAFSLMPFLFGSILFRLISDRIRFERLEKEARAQRLDAELKFLRSQVSPHFLFNMLTNMVSLARKKSDLLEPSLLRLSDLLRYMLYDSAAEKISVSSEIENIENYIELQKLRFGDDVQVEISIKNESPQLLIEPMLLIPFVENAFKHGIGLVSNPYIKVSVVVVNKALEYKVLNNFAKENGSKDKSSGIGLSNVKNRLELLYPNRYQLYINNAGGEFLIHLKLDLL